MLLLYHFCIAKIFYKYLSYKILSLQVNISGSVTCNVLPCVCLYTMLMCHIELIKESDNIERKYEDTYISRLGSPQLYHPLGMMILSIYV
jgi:hypothetical protein